MYSFKEFLANVEDLSLPEILAAAQSSKSNAERVSYGVKGAPRNREMGAPEYAEKLRGLEFFLANGIKPLGLASHDFALLKPMCEKLIAKGMLKNSVLTLFISEAC